MDPAVFRDVHPAAHRAGGRLPLRGARTQRALSRAPRRGRWRGRNRTRNAATPRRRMNRGCRIMGPPSDEVHRARGASAANSDAINDSKSAANREQGRMSGCSLRPREAGEPPSLSRRPRQATALATHANSEAGSGNRSGSAHQSLHPLPVSAPDIKRCRREASSRSRP